MDRFSEKSLLSLGDHYVYGLIDPRSKQIFYIGKGTKTECSSWMKDMSRDFLWMRMKHSTLESR